MKSLPALIQAGMTRDSKVEGGLGPKGDRWNRKRRGNIVRGVDEALRNTLIIYLWDLT